MTTTGQVRRLTLQDAPRVPGLEARLFHDASDYTRLSELTVEANQFDRIPYLPSARDLQVEMEAAEGLDPVDDVVFVEVDGRLIAATGVQRVVRDSVPTYDIWGTVDPGYRRRGLATALWGWTLDRARARAAREDLDAEVALGSFVDEGETGHRALMAKVGLEPVRHFFLMHRRALDDVPEAPLPDGIEIRPVREDQWRTILDAESEAFRDHWGHREMGESDFRATFGRPDLDTRLWVVAWAGDEVAGVVQNWIWPLENERLGVKRGWLEHISVRRPWRRRGLGRAITVAALVRLREAGLEEAMLGVDSENANGALGLYEDLGFTLESRAAAYRRPLRP